MPGRKFSIEPALPETYRYMDPPGTPQSRPGSDSKCRIWSVAWCPAQPDSQGYIFFVDYSNMYFRDRYLCILIWKPNVSTKKRSQYFPHFTIIFLFHLLPGPFTWDGFTKKRKKLILFNRDFHCKSPT